MHSNLTEEESRVVLEKLNSPESPMVASDRQLLEDARATMTQSVLSRAETHRRYLIDQGMHPATAAQHVRHRFGV